MPTVADYEDAVRRIVKANVDPDATTKAEVERALAGSEAPQVTREVAEGVADNVLTTDKVVSAIDASGELPSEGEIDAVVSVSDDYDMSDRVRAVSDEVRDTVATVEDVERAVRERQGQRGNQPTFREHVESAVDSVAGQKQFVGESPDEVAREQAREIGAPRESAFRDATVKASMPDSAVTPANRDDLSSNSKTPMNLIEDTSGNVVGAFGGASQGGVSPEETAAEMGVDYLGSTSEIDFNISGSGSRVDVTLRGHKVGEVDVE